MFWFCYFCKKIVFVLGMAHGDPIIEVGKKWLFLEVLANFFQNYWIPVIVININWICQHISLETSKKSQSGCGFAGLKIAGQWSLTIITAFETDQKLYSAVKMSGQDDRQYPVATAPLLILIHLQFLLEQSLPCFVIGMLSNLNLQQECCTGN